MDELTLKDHEELGGATFNNTGFFGGFKDELARLYNANSGDHIDDNFDDEWCNFMDAVARRLANVFQGVVCKSGGDADLEFSVRGFSVAAAGTVGTYAEETGIGDLTVSVPNYIYADLSAFPTITVGHATAGWPAGIHAQLAIITPPASGPWKLQHIERRSHVHGINVLAPGGVIAGALANAVADEILTASIAAGAEASDVIRVTFQVKDAQGNNVSGVKRVEWNLSDSASSASETAQSPTVAYVNGAAWNSITAHKKAVAFTDANGALVLDVTLTGDHSIYAVCSVGSKVYSQLLDFN